MPATKTRHVQRGSQIQPTQVGVEEYTGPRASNGTTTNKKRYVYAKQRCQTCPSCQILTFPDPAKAQDRGGEENRMVVGKKGAKARQVAASV